MKLPCRYEPILKTLHIHDRHEAFWLTKTNTCFTNGVFGSGWDGTSTEQDVVGYVTRTMCGNVNVSAKYVTLIHRAQRRLLNIDEMAKTARKVFGEKRVRVAILEEMNLAEQVSCRKRFLAFGGLKQRLTCDNIQ